MVERGWKFWSFEYRELRPRQGGTETVVSRDDVGEWLLERVRSPLARGGHEARR
jgi:hypothetical protein